MDVMFYEVFQEEESVLKKDLPKNLKAGFTWKTIQESHDTVSPARLISIRTQSRIPPAWAGQLKGILSRSQGYDHLVRYRREAGFSGACGYLENYCATAVAEHAVMMMMMILRKAKKQMSQFDAFCRDGITGMECRHRRVCVVGVGSIGTEIVEMARGLKMDVKGVDIESKREDLEYVSLNDGARWADVIFCALPLTDETRGMLSYKVLSQAAPGAVFLNISRAEISPIEDLKLLLDEHKLAGIGLDIYPEESRLANYLRGFDKEVSRNFEVIFELKNRDNVVFTPHNAFNTQEALRNKAYQSVESVVSFLNNGVFLKFVS